MTLVRWTDQAVDDLRSIRLFIERDSPRYARLVVERVVEFVTQLEAFPLSGRIVPEIEQPEIRELIVGEYRIVYRASESAVVIVTVFRSSRVLPWTP